MELSFRVIRNTLFLLLSISPSLLLADKLACDRTQSPSVTNTYNLNVTSPLYKPNSPPGFPSLMSSLLDVSSGGYSVEVVGDYSADQSSKAAEEKEALVAAALKSVFYTSYTCKLTFESDPSDATEQPRVQKSSSGDEKNDLQRLSENLDAAMQRHKRTVLLGDEYTFNLNVVAYKDVYPELNAFKEYVVQNQQAHTDDASAEYNASGSLENMPKVITLMIAAHGVAVFTQNYELLTTLILMDIGYVGMLAYELGFYSAMSALVISVNAAANGPVAVSAFTLYLQAALHDSFTVKTATFDDLDIDGFLEVEGHHVYKADETMKNEINILLGYLKKIPEGQEIKLNEIMSRSEFAEYQPKKPSAFMPLARSVVNGVTLLASVLRSMPEVTLFATQALFNEGIHRAFGKPLSRVLYPERCTKSASFYSHPLGYICYEAKWMALDAPLYVLGTGYGLYRFREKLFSLVTLTMALFTVGKVQSKSHQN